MELSPALASALHGRRVLVTGGLGFIGLNLTRALLDALARRIVELAGTGRIEVAPWPEQYEKVETGDFACDARRIGEILGWQPRVDLEEGLQRTVDAYRRLLA